MNKYLVCFGLCISSFVSAKPLIVLDTGHTPEVPGVISAINIPEFEYNRNFTTLLKSELGSRGWDVHDVRESMEDHSLTERTRHTSNAALFLAIHHDSMQQDWLDAGYRNKYKGFSIFVSNKNPYVSQSIQCAKHIGAGMLNSGEVPSLYHAADYPGEHKTFVDASRGVHVYDNLVVLKTSRSPAVLLEVGVVVNELEAVRLRDNKVVSGIVRNLAEQLERCKY